MARPAPDSLEIMIGGLLEAVKSLQSDVTEIRRDIKDSDSRAALSYEQSEHRAAESRAKMYQKTDELTEKFSATESVVKALTNDMVEVRKVTDDVVRWKLMGLGGLGVTGFAAASVASFLTAYWHDILRLMRGS